METVFQYADTYLRNIYTCVFGSVIIDVFVFFAGIVVIQAANEEERYEKMAHKVMAVSGEMKMQFLWFERSCTFLDYVETLKLLVSMPTPLMAIIFPWLFTERSKRWFDHFLPQQTSHAYTHIHAYLFIDTSVW